MILHGAVQKEHAVQIVKEAESCGVTARLYGEEGHLAPKKPGELDNGMLELELRGTAEQIMAFHATYPFTGPVPGMSPLTLRDGDEPPYIYWGRR